MTTEVLGYFRVPFGEHARRGEAQKFRTPHLLVTRGAQSRAMQATMIRFAEALNDVLSVVEIDAPLSAGGPDDAWRTLFELRTQIVSAKLRVVGDRLLQTLHLAELDGSVLDATRGRQIKKRLETAFGEQRGSGEPRWAPL